MQQLSQISKIILLAVLGCSLLVAWDSSNTDVLGWQETYTSTVNAPVIKPSIETVDSVWNDMSQALTLDHHTQSAQVQKEIRRLLANQNQFYKILTSAGPYIYYIFQQTQDHHLPAEIALIPVIESEFNPNDHSNKGALGLWQLMPQTAHELGVKDTSGYDGRRNVVASTQAALSYFNDLGSMFKGNWDLAIAAYNCGQGTVQSAERRTGNNSFWNLPLPKDTQYYVPRLLAIAEVIKNPEKYGVQLPPIMNKPFFSEIKVSKPVSLPKVAKSTGIDINTLQKLNPDYSHGVTAKKGTYTLLVPVNKTPIVQATLANKIVTAENKTSAKTTQIAKAKPAKAIQVAKAKPAKTIHIAKAKHKTKLSSKHKYRA